jgi:hypothetical protein
MGCFTNLGKRDESSDCYYLLYILYTRFEYVYCSFENVTNPLDAKEAYEVKFKNTVCISIWAGA